MKKRLFFAYGCWTLLNALNIIEQKNEKCLDTIVFNKHSAAVKLAGKLHNFHQIKVYNYWQFENFNLEEYDEIYPVEVHFFLKNNYFTGNFCTKLKKNNYCLISESIWLCLLKNRIEPYEGYINTLYYTDYLKKLSPVKMPQSITITEPDKKIMQTLFIKMQDICPLDIKLDNTKKSVLLTFQTHIYNVFGNDTKKQLEKVIYDFSRKNFNVYIKTHMSDNDDVKRIFWDLQKENDNVFVIDSELPAEIYDLDFTLVVSYFSTSLHTMYYYKDIPSAHLLDLNLLKYKSYFDLNAYGFIAFQAVALRYFLHYKKMLAKIDRDCSHKEAKEIFKKTFDENLAKCKDIQEDRFLSFILRLLYKLITVYKKIYYKKIHICCARFVKRALYNTIKLIIKLAFRYLFFAK